MFAKQTLHASVASASYRRQPMLHLINRFTKSKLDLADFADVVAKASAFCLVE
jgi:hypothetical protein